MRCKRGKPDPRAPQTSFAPSRSWRLAGWTTTAEQQPQGVDQQMPLASPDFLAAIEATRPPLMRLHRRASDDGGTGRRLAPRSSPRQFPHVGLHPFPRAVAAKLPKIVVNRRPQAVVTREVAPRTASPHQIEQPIDDAPQVAP